MATFSAFVLTFLGAFFNGVDPRVSFLIQGLRSALKGLRLGLHALVALILPAIAFIAVNAAARTISPAFIGLRIPPAVEMYYLTIVLRYVDIL
ncbi:MAG: hypothetical protein H6669_14860 [Ardenticatenaceae bacterium]|nr:hypothetical protein [Ardenticatenaceae bacterium]